VDHFDKSPVQAFKGGGKHDRGDKNAWDKKKKVRLSAKVSYICTHADSECYKIEKGLNKTHKKSGNDKPFVGNEIPEKYIIDPVRKVHSIKPLPVSFKKTSSRDAGLFK
jgi:hypothetical protein